MLFWRNVKFPKLKYAIIKLYSTVSKFNSCTKCVGCRGILLHCTPIATQFHRHKCMDDLTTERRFDLQDS